jgi:hypothetical protein
MQENRMKRLPLLLILVGSYTCFAQEPTPAKEPTMAETKAWIEAEGPAIMQSVQISRAGTFRSAVSDLVLHDCILSWNTSHNLHADVPLKDLDTGGLLVSSSTFMGSAPTWSLRIKTRSSVGPTINGWDRSRQAMVDVISESVRNQEDGNRLAAAIRRAAILCGAPASPF